MQLKTPLSPELGTRRCQAAAGARRPSNPAPRGPAVDLSYNSGDSCLAMGNKQNGDLEFMPISWYFSHRFAVSGMHVLDLLSVISDYFCCCLIPVVTYW